MHQTGHNSGVLHSGIYYKPGSLKAVNCRQGKQAMETFCREQGIEHEICGKIIVALEDQELPRLQNIFQRGQENGVNCSMISREEMREIEPHVAGLRAIRVPEAGIVNYQQVCLKLGDLVLEKEGNKVLTGHQVIGLIEKSDGLVIKTNRGEIECLHAVNCGGLHSDRITQLSGRKPPAKIVPFKGEYFELKESAKHLCKHLIYPVPDPKFPLSLIHI